MLGCWDAGGGRNLLAGRAGFRNRRTYDARPQLLNRDVFEYLRRAQAYPARWRTDRCHRRPQSAFGYVPLAKLVAQLRDAGKDAGKQGCSAAWFWKERG